MNNIKNDINLREAVSRHEQKLPPMPADLNERVMKRAPLLTSPKGEERKQRRLWPFIVAACVAGFVAIFLVPPRETNVEPEQQPVVAQQVEKQEKPVVKEEPAETITEVTVPKKTRRAPKRKPVVQQEPIEEPLLAEAEAMPMPEQAEDPIEKAVRVRRELRQRGEQVEQYVAMLNERVKSEHHYVQF